VDQAKMLGRQFIDQEKTSRLFRSFFGQMYFGQMFFAESRGTKQDNSKHIFSPGKINKSLETFLVHKLC
jgi:hypothetical protein